LIPSLKLVVLLGSGLLSVSVVDKTVRILATETTVDSAKINYANVCLIHLRRFPSSSHTICAHKGSGRLSDCRKDKCFLFGFDPDPSRSGSPSSFFFLSLFCLIDRPLI